jgi:hypothetical protein
MRSAHLAATVYILVPDVPADELASTLYADDFTHCDLLPPILAYHGCYPSVIHLSDVGMRRAASFTAAFIPPPF